MTWTLPVWYSLYSITTSQHLRTIIMKNEVKVIQSCPTLWDPYIPWNSPGQNTGVGSLSLLQGIFPTQVSHIAGRFFTSWATGEAHLPDGSDGKASCLQCGRPGFDPWVGKILGRRKWQPTPVPLHGKSREWRSLVGYSRWGPKESGTTVRLHFHFQPSLVGQGRWGESGGAALVLVTLTQTEEWNGELAKNASQLSISVALVSVRVPTF